MTSNLTSPGPQFEDLLHLPIQVLHAKLSLTINFDNDNNTCILIIQKKNKRLLELAALRVKDDGDIEPHLGSKSCILIIQIVYCICIVI